ncbi:MAG: hypothetical protein HUU26_14485 [Gemmatimonadaceae bacterium]|nr:hypothetical protein [Gemmatimonadaceae bacterium]
MLLQSLFSPRRLARALSAAAMVAFAALGSTSVTGCGGGDDDDGTGPGNQSLCASASFSNGAEIGFNLGCNSYDVSVSGITYDQFSRVTSYNYDISCTGGSNRRSGRVYNITYNNLGQALTWDYTVNGQTCRKS